MRLFRFSKERLSRSSDIILIFPGINRTSILAKSSTEGSIKSPHFSLGSHQIGFSRKIVSDKTKDKKVHLRTDGSAVHGIVLTYFCCVGETLGAGV
jgi:hypothetical protein